MGLTARAFERAGVKIAGGVFAAASLVSCLQPDTKPPPGSMFITVSPSDAVTGGTMTADGWAISFDRVLLGIGNAAIDDCIAYADTRYDRILDPKADPGQKLVVLYGLGSCTFRFRVSAPSSDAILGAGVSEADKTFMRSPGADPTEGGVAVDISGSAARDGFVERFHWSFRRATRFRSCVAAFDDGGPSGLIRFESNQALAYDLVVSAEALFRSDGRAPLAFDPVAAADLVYGDRDGIITLDELGRVAPAGLLEEASSYVYLGEGGADASDAGLTSLAVRMRDERLPRMIQFRDGLVCPLTNLPPADL
jgi:hypothetical protein